VTTKKKLILLELTAGLFGWAWMIASIAALVYLVLAIGFNGSWSTFFWALGIGIVAKWLAKGFQDHQARVAFEAKKIVEGMSPEEAGKEWLNRYLK
jgi:uncharacterized membrane protein YjjB (DUF3815 family)